MTIMDLNNELACCDCGSDRREERECRDDEQKIHITWTVCADCGQSTQIGRAYFKKQRPTQH